MASFVLPLFPLSLVITVTFYQIKLQLVIYNSSVFLFVKYNFNSNKSIYNNFCIDSIFTILIYLVKKFREKKIDETGPDICRPIHHPFGGGSEEAGVELVAIFYTPLAAARG